MPRFFLVFEQYTPYTTINAMILSQLDQKLPSEVVVYCVISVCEFINNQITHGKTDYYLYK